MSAQPFSRQQQIAFKIDRLDLSAHKLLSYIIHRITTFFPTGLIRIVPHWARVTVINRASAQRKAVFYFYWQPRREVSISELVSFVISHIGGTEVISLDVCVNDFLSRVAQFSCAREKARRPDGLNRGTSIAPRFIASRTQRKACQAKKNVIRKNTTCCRIKMRHQTSVYFEIIAFFSHPD